MPLLKIQVLLFMNMCILCMHTHTYNVPLRLYTTMPMIKLQSSDGEIFDVDVEIAKASNTIKTMIEGKTMDVHDCMM